uniref:Uncharacterized protein n=1 Tax=Glossina austeni TaxID=7395 RepID=A0A1A9VSS7_GLOAU
MGSGSFSYGSSAFKISATISTLPSSSCLTFGKLKRGSNSLAASLFKMRTEDLFNNFGLMLLLVVSTTSTGSEFMLTNSVSSTSSDATKRCTSSMNKSSSFSILLRKLAVASSSIASTLVRTGVGGTGTAAGSEFKIFLGTALNEAFDSWGVRSKFLSVDAVGLLKGAVERLLRFKDHISRKNLVIGGSRQRLQESNAPRRNGFFNAVPEKILNANPPAFAGPDDDALLNFLKKIENDGELFIKDVQRLVVSEMVNTNSYPIQQPQL